MELQGRHNADMLCTMKILGKQLRRYREAKQLTQDELSKHAKVQKGHISDIETGKRTNDTLDVLYRLVDALMN